MADSGLLLDKEYKHTIDNSGINHALKKHGGSSEEQRGQLQLTESDFELVEDVINNYDAVEVDESAQPLVIKYRKQYENGITIYIEEVRTGRKELALKTMYKRKVDNVPDEHLQKPSSDTSVTTSGSVANPTTDKGNEKEEIRAADDKKADELWELAHRDLDPRSPTYEEDRKKEAEALKAWKEYIDRPYRSSINEHVWYGRYENGCRKIYYDEEEIGTLDDDRVYSDNGKKRFFVGDEAEQELVDFYLRNDAVKSVDEITDEGYTVGTEKDSRGNPFVLSSEGNIDFGQIRPETGLTPAPIRLSEGQITNTETNSGYGLKHIEARHGDEIRKAGFASVREFVEHVAKNYNRIQEGAETQAKDGTKYQSYLIQLTDEHNNTLFVELSSNGEYWSINSAGVFNQKYGDNKKNIWSASSVQNVDPATNSGGLRENGETGSTSTPKETPPQTSSTDKDTKFRKGQGETTTAIANTATVHSAASDLQQQFGVEVEVIDSPDGIPNATARKAIAAGQNVKGWHDIKTGKVYLYAPNIESKQDAATTYIHEVVAHSGMRQLLGEDKYNELCEKLYDQLTDEQKERISQYSDQSAEVQGDEYFAAIAETMIDERGNIKEPSLFRKFVATIRNFFRNILGISLSDNDIRYMLWKSANNLKRNSNKATQLNDAITEMRFSMESENTSDARFAIGRKRKDDMRRGLLNKLTNATEEQVEQTIIEIEKLGEQSKAGGDAKVEKAALHWAKQGTIVLPEDGGVVRQAVALTDKYGIDFTTFNNPRQLIEETEEKHQEEKKKPINPDLVPTLRNKQVLKNGITVYDVDDGRESQINVRRIIDTHFGKDAQPWCLFDTDNGELAEDAIYRWDHSYKGCQRRIAFKDGHLISFCANDQRGVMWWDRQDSPSENIPYRGKIANDELGRVATMYFDPKDGTQIKGEFDDIKVGQKNAPNTTYEEWYDLDHIAYRASYDDYGDKIGLEIHWFPEDLIKSLKTYAEGSPLERGLCYTFGNPCTIAIHPTHGTSNYFDAGPLLDEDVIWLAEKMNGASDEALKTIQTEKDLLAVLEIKYYIDDDVEEDEDDLRFNIAKKKNITQNRAGSPAKAGANATVVSSDATARLQINLNNLAKKYNKKTGTRGFITDLTQALGLEQHEASRYRNFELPDGRFVTFRLSNHNASAATFDERGEQEGISIVISSSRNNGIKNNGSAHVVEYFYGKKTLDRAEDNPLAAIVKSVSEMFKTGEYVDTTGLAEVSEVNAPRFDIGENDAETTAPFSAERTDVHSVASDLQQQFGVEVEVIDSPDNIPNATARKAIAAGQNVKGWYDIKTGKVYLYAPNIESKQDAATTYIHEVVAHSGMRQLLGEDKYNELCEKLYNQLTDEQKERISQYSDQSAEVQGDEYFAAIAETMIDERGNIKEPSLFRKFVATIRNFFRNILGISLSDNDIRYMLWKSANNLKRNSNKATQLNDAITEMRFSMESENTAEEEQIIRDAKANGTYLKAPNGKDTNLTPKQWVRVRTKAFKRWFGDWENDPENASKVVDENGEPLVLYHGTSEFGFSVFDSEYSDDGLSLFFSLDEDVARSYAGINAKTRNIGSEGTFQDKRAMLDAFFEEQDLSMGDPYDVYEPLFYASKDLDISVEWNDDDGSLELESSVTGSRLEMDDNTYDYDTLYNWLLENAAIENMGEENAGIYAVFLNAKKVLTIDAGGGLWSFIPTKLIEGYDGSCKNVNTREIAAFAASKGYDAVHITELLDAGSNGYGAVGDSPSDIWISLNGGSAIKSATENNGDYDQNNDDVRFAIGNPYDRKEYPRGYAEPNLATTDVNIVSVPKHNFSGSAKEATQQAKDWAKENIVRTYTDEETGGKGRIRISANSIHECLNPNALAKSANINAHISALTKLPEIIRESVDCESHPDFNPKMSLEISV